MSGIVDSQGRPTRPALKEEDIINTFNQIVQGMREFEERLHIVHNQITHTGLIIEFMIGKLRDNGIAFSDEEFSAYAQARIAEVRAEAEAAQKEVDTLSSTTINLDDDE